MCAQASGHHLVRPVINGSKKLDCTCARRPSTSEALREIEAAMRSIEAAESPRAAAAAAAQLRTYDNSFWEPDSRPAQVRHPAPAIVSLEEKVSINDG